MTRKDVLWKIDGFYYDLSTFLDHHPGGRTALELARGQDCTILFYTYHLRLSENSYHWDMLKSFLVEPAPSDIDKKSESLSHDELYWEMKKEVCRVVENPKIPWTRLCVAVVALVVQWFSIWKWLSLGSIVWGALAGFLNMFGALQWSHDASHFAAFSSPFANEVAVWTALPFIYHPQWWYLQHIVQHHVYTNDRGDVDLIHLSPFGRLSPLSKWRWYFVFNEWVATFYLMTMATLAESIHYPFQIAYSFLKKGHLRFLRLLAFCGNAEAFLFGSWRKVFLFVLPWMISVVPLVYVALVHSVMAASTPFLVTGIYFIAITQVSHLQPECQDPDVERLDENGEKILPWSHRQLLHAVDYQPENKWVNVFTGGLHIQTLHHLFPSVHHAHLSKLWPRLNAIASSHGVHLATRRNLFDALGTCWQWMRELGSRLNKNV